MKLIIDVPEEEYKAIKDYPNVYNSELHKAIANGTPYNPSGDLISREALLDQIDTTDWDNVRTLVEDAQTVEPICPYLSNDDVKQPCLNSPCERPQGKLIKCQDCRYRVKRWREDKRIKEKGYWEYGCEHFGEIMGYWGFGGYDDEFCSDAEQKGGAE